MSRESQYVIGTPISWLVSKIFAFLCLLSSVAALRENNPRRLLTEINSCLIYFRPTIILKINFDPRTAQIIISTTEIIMERRTCVVPLCRNERFHLVHKFPMKDSRAEMWRVALNIPELMDMDMKELRLKHLVCSRHFKKTDYKNINSRNLNWNAVPSINLISFDDKNCYDSATFNILTNQPISFSDTKPESIVPLKRTGSIYDTNALTMEETPGRSSVPQPQDISPRIPTKNTQRSKEVIRSISMPALTKNAAPQMRKPGKRKREEEPKVIDLATESHGQGLLILEAAQEDTPSLTEQDVLDRILSNIQIDPGDYD